MRVLALIWAAHTSRYVIELWDTAGNEIKERELTRAWFPPQRTQPESGEPIPRLQAIRQDEGGRLWVVIEVPDPDWSPDTSRLHVRAGFDFNEYYDTVIEVVDPGNGELLGRARMDESINGFVGPQLIGGMTFDAMGVPYYTVWRVELVAK